MPLSGAFIPSSMEAVAFWRRLSGVISASCALAGAATANAVARESRAATIRARRNDLRRDSLAAFASSGIREVLRFVRIGHSGNCVMQMLDEHQDSVDR